MIHQVSKLERWIDTHIVRPTILQRTGGTIWRRGQFIGKRGYAVGILEVSPDQVSFIADWLNRKHKTGIPVYGGWFNRTTCEGEYDIGIVVDDRQAAIQLARQYNQLAIFDFANQSEIRID